MHAEYLLPGHGRSAVECVLLQCKIGYLYELYNSSTIESIFLYMIENNF